MGDDSGFDLTGAAVLAGRVRADQGFEFGDGDLGSRPDGSHTSTRPVAACPRDDEFEVSRPGRFRGVALVLDRLLGQRHSGRGRAGMVVESLDFFQLVPDRRGFRLAAFEFAPGAFGRLRVSAMPAFYFLR